MDLKAFRAMRQSYECAVNWDFSLIRRQIMEIQCAKWLKEYHMIDVSQPENPSAIVGQVIME